MRVCVHICIHICRAVFIPHHACMQVPTQTHTMGDMHAHTHTGTSPNQRPRLRRPPPALRSVKPARKCCSSVLSPVYAGDRVPPTLGIECPSPELAFGWGKEKGPWGGWSSLSLPSLSSWSTLR